MRQIFAKKPLRANCHSLHCPSANLASIAAIGTPWKRRKITTAVVPKRPAMEAVGQKSYEGNQEAATRYEALLTSHCKGERIIEM